MSYTPQKSPAQIALDQIEISTGIVAGSAAYIARTLNAAHAYIWGLPDAVLNEVLADMGQVKVEELLLDHYTIGTASNQILERAGIEDRAIVIAGREIILTDGVFSVTPLPEPEPDPEPDPE